MLTNRRAPKVVELVEGTAADNASHCRHLLCEVVRERWMGLAARAELASIGTFLRQWQRRLVARARLSG